MSAPHSANNHPPGIFWPVANVLLGLFFGLFALYWGFVLVKGGIKASMALRSPKPAATAPAAPADTPAAAAAPSAEAAAPAPPAANPSLPVAEVTIKPAGPSGLEYDTKAFSVKSGQKVKLTFDHHHPLPQPHNWVLGKPGTKDKIMAAAMAIMTDPKALEKGYIPESPDILHHTKLVQPNSIDSIEFTAPAPGQYPYLCTFPGHAILMNGVMTVE